MKNIILAGAISMVAGAALAGGYSEPVMAPEIVIESAVESAGSDAWVGVLMTFITIVMLGVGG